MPDDLFVEVDHGPFLVDNNLFLSACDLWTCSQGGAYVHNLFAGAIKLLPYDSRQTPFLKPHSTEVAGYHDNPNGDDRFYNNLFTRGADLRVYDRAPLPMRMEGNVYADKAQPCQLENAPVVSWAFSPLGSVEESPEGVYLALTYDAGSTSDHGRRTRRWVTSGILGRAVISGAAYEHPDGTPIRIDTDYLGKKRNESNPSPGPIREPRPRLLQGEGVAAGSPALTRAIYEALLTRSPQAHPLTCLAPADEDAGGEPPSPPRGRGRRLRLTSPRPPGERGRGEGVLLYTELRGDQKKRKHSTPPLILRPALHGVGRLPVHPHCSHASR